jgi:uncharacterized protein (DUF58 family)
MDDARARRGAEGRGGWAQSPAQTGAALVGLVCVVGAFILGRVELAFVGAPLLLAALVDRARRPRGITRVVVAATVEGDGGGDGGGPDGGGPDGGRPDGGERSPTVPVTVRADSADAVVADAVQLRLAPADRAPFDVFLPPGAAARLRLDVPVRHSGPQRVVAVQARTIGSGASWVGEAGTPAAVDRVVRPAAVPLRSLPLPARLLGLTGQHISSRPGEGGEFRDVDRYRSGDRLRRIDWKATARRAQRPGELYVRRTTATSDAAVHIVVDARDDLPAEVADWAAPYPRPGVRSLDLAREAAVSLVAAYTASADRVGFDDLGDARRALPPRGGRRHRQAVVRAIETTAARGSATDRIRAPRLAPGALVYVLSTFLDDQPLRLALVWRAAGHRVIAVDVLPAPVTDGLPAREAVALRVVVAERAVRWARMAAAGVDTLTWAAADRDAQLRRLAAPPARRAEGRAV